MSGGIRCGTGTAPSSVSASAVPRWPRERSQVLAEVQRYAEQENMIARKVGVDGADWAEVMVQVKTPNDSGDCLCQRRPRSGSVAF